MVGTPTSSRTIRAKLKSLVKKHQNKKSNWGGKIDGSRSPPLSIKTLFRIFPPSAHCERWRGPVNHYKDRNHETTRTIDPLVRALR